MPGRIKSESLTGCRRNAQCRRRQPRGGAAFLAERPLDHLQCLRHRRLFCGLGAFVLSARLNSAEAVAGTGYELTVIASVVIGGTSLFGGSGGIFGTVVGTVLIGVLLNGLVILNVSPYIQQIIIVLAVAFDTYAKSRRW